MYAYCALIVCSSYAHRTLIRRFFPGTLKAMLSERISGDHLIFLISAILKRVMNF